MRQLLKKVSQRALLILLVPLVLLCLVIFILALPFILLCAHFSDKQFQKRYKLFLERMEGACYFCYNSRKSSVEFARDVIVPELSAPVRVVFVDGNKVVADADRDCISKMLYGITERKGFPYLLKIENGQVVDLSVNNQFYSILIGRKSTVPLLDRIKAFFVSTNPDSSV